MARGPYRIPNVRATGRAVYTNKLRAGGFRGFGNPQSTFAGECQIDELADALGLDPFDVRLKNAMRAGDTWLGGQTVEACGLVECIEKLRAATAQAAARDSSVRRQETRSRHFLPCPCLRFPLDRRQRPPAGGRHRHPRHGRGGLRPGIGHRARPDLRRRARPRHLEGELRQPGHRRFALQLEHLGQPDDLHGRPRGRRGLGRGEGAHLRARRGDDGMRDRGSRAAPRRTGRHRRHPRPRGELRRGLRPGSLGRRRADHGPERADVRRRAFRSRSGPSSRASPSPISAPTCSARRRWRSRSTRPPAASPWSRRWSAHDVGRAINPLAVEGQIQGGFVQGIGYALTEELVWEDGALVNPSMMDYKAPSAMDVPSRDPPDHRGAPRALRSVRRQGGRRARSDRGRAGDLQRGGPRDGNQAARSPDDPGTGAAGPPPAG